ncbi:hypothetical protein [Marinimicrobium sp. ABcell2]|uniref:hypothetical protein n=1 Tax=Marinimicrobium sp. ABcell2 TaxID=3069751 RepID=UPI0027B7BF35|nr:hypothetical protein [Marinimicrobium sp. ABcell2]MDQ2076794.1 hypothetical protein [Marinimicrobium sp. ABcell2]
MLTNIFYVWSDSPALSLAIWLVICITLLYAGRPHGHQLLRSTGRAIYTSLRLASASIRQLEERVKERNRDVLLAMGREASEKAVEREFHRINAIVERDLSQYPSLHRKLADTLQKIQDDYHEASGEVLLPPAWSEVMDTIASLPTSGDPAVVKILENIQDAVENSHQQSFKAYQKNANERHKILNSMQPEWRTLNSTMSKVQNMLTGLEERSKIIDRHMADYESLRKAEDKAVNSLTASSLTQFFIASLVLVIAAFGGIINFHLIALPMSEMVGGASYIGSVRTSDVAALVIIMMEITMGLFLLEALQITRLFPVIGSLDDKMRKRIAIAAFTILVIFASIEASLAYMRDLLALDREALAQSLAGATVAEAQFRWIPSIGQLVLGFILPFALAFVGIPLESFVHSLRTVLGLLLLGFLRTLRVLIRTTGGMANHLSKMLVSFYDLLIMIPLSIERAVKWHRENSTQNARLEASELDAEDESAPVGPKKRKATSRRSRTVDDVADDLPFNVQEA